MVLNCPYDAELAFNLIALPEIYFYGKDETYNK
jgi:hypothetical protein